MARSKNPQDMSLGSAMRIGETAIERARLVTFAVLLVAGVGIFAFTQLGRLEDPEFTIRSALVLTQYPGADAARVEQEVTEPLELQIQQLGELDDLESFSRDGFSLIYVHVDDRYGGQRLRQIWDELHKQVYRAAAELPSEVRGPLIEDDYGDVYGVLLALTGDGFSYADLEEITEDVQQELLRVPDVAKVDIFGSQGERIYLETTRAKIAELGLHPQLVALALNRRNVVEPSGFVELGPRELPIYTSGLFRSIDEIARMQIRSPVTGELVRVEDFAEVGRGYADPPEAMLRFNGEATLALGVVPTEGANVVELGRRVQDEIARIEQRLPAGVEFGVIALQSEEVERAIGEFLTNLGSAVAIVLVVMMVSLGLRTGVIVGVGVPLSILATFAVMWVSGIELHRVSLGALVIVLGMLVDNAIVVSELMLVKMQRGDERIEAAREAVSETALPLLAATLIAMLAFSPVVMTQSATGEFTGALFWVVAASLLASWLLSVTLTPVMGYRYLRPSGGAGSDPYDHRIYGWFRTLTRTVLAYRRTTLLGVLGLLVVAFLGFLLVPQIFFPPAQRAQFLVDYWLPEGSRIEQTSGDMREIEAFLGGLDEVTDVTAFIGEGAPRFYLPMIPEPPNPAFGQILVNLGEVEDLDATMEKTRAFMSRRFADAQPRVRPMQLGEPVRYPLKLRISGRDKDELHALQAEARRVIEEHPGVAEVRHNWRQRTARLEVVVDQDRAALANVSSAGVAEALQAGFAGRPIGLYHEGDERIPIVWRFPAEDRLDAANVANMIVWPEGPGRPVPLAQVAEIELSWAESMIWRFNRRRAITVQADLKPGFTSHGVQHDLDDAVQALELPAGYSLEWDGETAQAAEARADVLGPVPVVLGLIALILMAQFNSYRRTAIIFLTVPLGLFGASFGLLIFRQPFGFMALLGVMSLAGMIIRNAIVMIEQIDLESERRERVFDAVLEASVSRVRPVLLAAMTTVLGMLPLAISGPFWAPMALAIMFGLAFASVLTLLVVPVLYAALFRVPQEPRAPKA